MKNFVRAVALGGALATAGARAADVPDYDPSKVDLVDAITCKLKVPEYNGFAITVSDEDGGIAKTRGWTPVKSANFLLSEYRLPTPIIVAGITTDRIGFSSSGVVAILDVADPTALGVAEKIDNQSGPAAVAALAADLKLTPAQIKALPDNHVFRGERVVAETTEFDPELDMTIKTRITQSIKTATTHPGKTLFGCNYQMDMKPGKPAS